MKYTDEQKRHLWRAIEQLTLNHIVDVNMNKGITDNGDANELYDLIKNFVLEEYCYQEECNDVLEYLDQLDMQHHEDGKLMLFCTCELCQLINYCFTSTMIALRDGHTKVSDTSTFTKEETFLFEKVSKQILENILVNIDEITLDEKSKVLSLELFLDMFLDGSEDLCSNLPSLKEYIENSNFEFPEDCEEDCTCGICMFENFSLKYIYDKILDFGYTFSAVSSSDVSSILFASTGSSGRSIVLKAIAEIFKDLFWFF